MRPFVISATCVGLTGAQTHIGGLPGVAVEIAIGAIGYFQQRSGEVARFAHLAAYEPDCEQQAAFDRLATFHRVGITCPDRYGWPMPAPECVTL